MTRSNSRLPAARCRVVGVAAGSCHSETVCNSLAIHKEANLARSIDRDR